MPSAQQFFQAFKTKTNSMVPAQPDRRQDRKEYKTIDHTINEYEEISHTNVQVRLMNASEKKETKGLT